MIVRDRIIVMVLTVGLAATVRADMMPVCNSDTGHPPGVCACSQERSSSVDPLGLNDVPSLDDLGIQPVARLPDIQPNVALTDDTRPVSVLANDQGSVGLCLYALLGLGLCRSVPWVKKFSFGCVPDWYHHGGPVQIGHSYAMGPDCLCSATAVCFIQPDYTTQGLLPRHYWRTVAPLSPKSLFTSDVLASRGPPFHLC